MRVLRKSLQRRQVLEFFDRQPRCVVTMKACGAAHLWGREIGKPGQNVLLILSVYVQPFGPRPKSDAAGAEAICQAAQRHTIRFVAVKSDDSQAAAVSFRTRDLLICRQTELSSALRGHMASSGWCCEVRLGSRGWSCPILTRWFRRQRGPSVSRFGVCR